MRDYICFLLKSTNEHGIHSPFLFSFVTKGLYAPQVELKGKNKKVAFLNRVITYFQPKTLMYSSAKSKNFASFPNTTTVSWNNSMLSTVDMFLIDETSTLEPKEMQALLTKMKNDAFIVLDKRNRSASINTLWETILASDYTTLSVDFYFFGIAFVRKEQLKQHFRVRL